MSDRDVKWFSLPCVHATRLISESLERPLSRKERVSLALHMALCKWCRRFRRQTLMIREWVRTFASPDAALTGSTLPVEARRRIEQALRNAPDSDPGGINRG